MSKAEDWVWLRLTDYESFAANGQKGKSRFQDLFGCELKIETTVSDDLDQVMGMIKELAIYESMLDQCDMTVEWLKEDYTNKPTPKLNTNLKGPIYISTIAWHNGKPIGYTVSIGE